MAEVTNPGEDHGEAEFVGGVDYVLISYGTAGLDDGGGAGLGYGFKAVGEGEKGVGGGYAALEREDRFHGAEAGGVHAAHLARADAQGLAVAGVDDGVGFDVLGHAPGEEQAAQLLGGGRTPGDDFQLRFGDAGGVGVLEEQSAGDVLDDGPGRGGLDFDQAQVLFGGEPLAGFGGEGRSGDGFDEEFGDFGGGLGVDEAVDADDAAEG